MKVKHELEKLHNMNWKARLDYIWTYYRFLLAAVLFAAVLAGEVVSTVQGAEKETALSVVVVNGSRFDEKKIEELERTLLSCTGLGEAAAEVKVDASVMAGDLSAQEIKKTLSISYLGQNDVVICDRDTYERYQREGAFASWETVLGEETGQYEAYRKDEAMDLSMSPVWDDIGITDYEPAYCCVLQGGIQKENVRRMLKYLFLYH